MRSWTIFILFGIVLVALLIYTQLAKYSTTTHPAVLAAQSFFNAVKSNSAAEATKYLDTTNATLHANGNFIVSLDFKETMPANGAFLRQPAAHWTYATLTSMSVDTDTQPREDDTASIATVRLSGGYTALLKKGDTGWKLHYILQPKAHQ